MTALTARTEGWAAGLQLAGLSLRGQPDADGFVAAFSGSHRYVLDYLAEEVLDRQPRRSARVPAGKPRCSTGCPGSCAMWSAAEAAARHC